MLSKQEAFLHSALTLFAHSNQRSVLTWNALLRDCARHGEPGLLPLHFFYQMQQQAILPNRVSYILTLSSLPPHSSLIFHGKRLHASTQACTFRTHVVVGTSIFNMYARCGSMQAAWAVFCDMPTRDIVSWNAMLSLHANHCLCQQTLHIFARLLVEEPAIPNNGTYVSVLGACANQADILAGRVVHNCITESMLDIDVIVATSLVSMYGKCNCLEDANRVFTTMSDRNVIPWNALIFQFAQQKQSQRSLDFYKQMQVEGILPDDITYISLFVACAFEGKLAEGEKFFASILSSGLKLDVIIGNSVLNMYGKCGNLERAPFVLDVMQDHNVITWTTLITAYTHNNQCKLAWECYQQMLQARIIPNQVTFIGILDTCTSLGDYEKGKLVHAQIVEDGCEGEKIILNSLTSMYGKCCSMQDALDTFHKMKDPDVVSWNSIITAYICQEDNNKAFEMFVKFLKGATLPNLFTYVSMLDVCANLFAIVEGQQLHALVVENGFEMETIVGTALINMYGKCSMAEDAQQAFNMIHEQNVISWTAVITAYAQQKQGEEAIRLFDQMQEKGIKPSNITFTSILASFSATENVGEAQQMCHRILNCGLDMDVLIGNTIVNMYGKCGNVNCARMAFDKMQERDLISWNSMMGVYAQHGILQDVLLFFDQMLWEGLMPDTVTFLSVMYACSRQLALIQGKQFHSYLMEIGYLKDTMLGTAMITFYGKCGNVNDALLVFNNMPKHDVVSWTVMIIACAKNGQAKEAMQLFHQMQQEGVTPNEVTFSNVINSCSHAGLFQDGLLCFSSMVETHKIAPEVEHYVSMIDLLGRAGQIHQADSLISDMPFQPTAVPYMTLLGACRQPQDVLQGEQAAGQAIELESDVTAPYVVLSNIHAALHA